MVNNNNKESYYMMEKIFLGILLELGFDRIKEKKMKMMRDIE